MHPDHHLASLIPARIHGAVQRLQGAIWGPMTPLAVEATAAGPRQLAPEEAMRLPRRAVKPGTFWGRLFDQRWCRVALPAVPKGAFLHWKDQGEATLYHRGRPHAGLDVAHKFCRVPAGARELWIESNCIQSAIWHPEADGMEAGGSYFAGAFLSVRNEEAWQGYHDLKCLFDLALDQRMRENPAAGDTVRPIGFQTPVERHSPFFRQLLRWLDQAVDALDRDGLGALRAKLAEAYAALRVDKTFMTCVLTGHAHIDLVWIWPERMGELKAVHTFATMNRLMDEYPEFRFAYSQTASYEAVRRRAPELYAEVRKRIASGQWEATGGMFVESDTLLACGEALARSFTLGQKGFREIAGKASRLTWLPDVFGYSACLPQLMKLTGVDYFFTTKMTWNAVNRFPYSSFIWRGHDGSEVVAHVTQETGYVTHMKVSDVRNPMLGHQQADVHPEYLLPTGYGDGGGGPTPEMCEIARRLGSLAGMPALAWDHPEAFFDRLGKIRDRLPVYQGECYLEYHRGTFTTHGALKAAFRGLERALQAAEAVAAVRGAARDFEPAWKRLVFAQFHDYIPGSSVWDVYAEGVPELERIAGEETAWAGQALAEGKAAATDCVFNPLPLPVHRVLRTPEGKEARVDLPPLAGTAWAEAAGAEPPAPVVVRGARAGNGLVDFELDAAGWIKTLRWEGAEVPLRGALGQLVLYPDQPALFEAWDIDRQALALGEPCRKKAAIAPWRDGELRQGFRVTRPVGRQSTAEVILYLEAGSPLLHVRIGLDWNEPSHLLKLHFPTAYGATHARFGAPFGSVLRPQLHSGLTAEAMWEVPFSRYLAVFDEGEAEGLFMATEAKYGASVLEGDIGLSLVRSPLITGFEIHGAAWPAHLSRIQPKSPHADIGRHAIRLALGRYATSLPRERQPAAQAEILFAEPIAYCGRPLPGPLEAIEGGETLVPAWTQPLEDGSFLVRCHEVAGRRGVIRPRVAPGWTVASSGLTGETPRRLGPEGLAFRPYEIVTLRLSRKRRE